MLSRIYLPALLLLTVVSLGCSSDPRSVDVSGTVTFDGAPVPYGRVQFVPDADGPPGWAIIENGKFDTAAEEGSPTIGGPHTINIEGYASVPDPNSDTENGVKPLFSGYTTTLDLGMEKSEQTIEVPKTAASRGGGK